MFTFWGIFELLPVYQCLWESSLGYILWAQNTSFLAHNCITACQCYMDEWEQCQNILIVCRSRLIYGLHEVIRVSALLYINVYILGHFWAQNTSFLAITACQCCMDEWEQCQNVLIVCRSRLIYCLHYVIRVSELFYINVYILGHFWAQNPNFQAITAYQCYMDKWEQCENVLMVCGSRLIYGLHYVIRVSEIFYINVYILVHFWAQNPNFQAITAYQCYMDKWEQYQNILIVCRSRLIYGLHEVIRVSELLYINVYILGHFWAQNTSFLAITACQCYMDEWEQCQNVLIVCRSRLIYCLHYVIRVSELFYINVYILGHFWAQNTSFLAITACQCYMDEWEQCQNQS